MPSELHPTKASSRKLADLHPEMAKRYNLALCQFAAKYPKLPQPFLTQTFRSKADQTASYAQGRTKPGKRVTNARWSQSLHNYFPSLAFDIAFDADPDPKKTRLDWNSDLFAKFAKIAESVGLYWGGRFGDSPHFEPPKFTYRDAAAGKEPKFLI